MALTEPCRVGPDRSPSQLRLALSVGLVGGFVLGCREGIISLQANAAVQPDQYLFGYLADPIVAWMVLGPLLLMPFAAVLAVVRRAGQVAADPKGELGRHSSPVRGLASLPIYVTVLTASGLLSAVVPALLSATDQVWAVGSGVGFSLHLLMWACGLALAAAGAALAGAGAAAYRQQIERWLPWATVTVCAFAPILLWPVMRFLATDWKFDLRPAGAAIAANPRLTSSAAPFVKGGGPRSGWGIYRPQGQPNVLLVSIDTLRADHLGSYGDPHGLTPNFDRLAREGVTFTQAITSSPWTLPAMASLFTARHPRHHGAGIITNHRTPLGRSALPAGAWTLARALHERGYRTHAIVTNPYLALRYGFGEDFETYENVTVESEAFVSFSQTTVVRAFTWLWPQLVIGDRGETVSQRALSILDRFSGSRPVDSRATNRGSPQDSLTRSDAHTSAPFLLWLHYIDPHAPYSRPGATRHKSMRGDLSFDSGSRVKRGSASLVTLTSPDVARLRSGEIRLSAEEKEAVRDLYRAEVVSVDAAVGRVVDALDHAGLSEDTLVVVVGDHGEEFWEHGGVEHGCTVYDEVARIPLLMRWPGHLPAGTRIDALTRITDIAPTILDLLGLETPPGRDGETLLPLVHGETPAPRVALIENMLFAEERVGVRTAERKYVLWDDGKEEVYDLIADPQERIDLAGVAGVLPPMRQLYAGLNAEGKRVAFLPLPLPAIGDGAAEALRTLGYLSR